ncbi:MAG: hypothetical protein ACM3NH_04665 [Candidatus Saccharibacteria bacterium]
MNLFLIGLERKLLAALSRDQDKSSTQLAEEIERKTGTRPSISELHITLDSLVNRGDVRRTLKEAPLRQSASRHGALEAYFRLT